MNHEAIAIPVVDETNPQHDSRIKGLQQAVQTLGSDRIMSSDRTMVQLDSRWTTFRHSSHLQDWLLGEDSSKAYLQINYRSQTLDVETVNDNQLNLHFYPTIEAYGIEIECYSGWEHKEIAEAIREEGISAYPYGEDPPHQAWVIKPDWTVEPEGQWICAEAQSPVLAPKEVDHHVHTVCDVLHDIGAKIDETCGLHVHVSDRYLGATEKAAIAWQYIRNETAIDSLMDPIRRKSRNDFTQGWTDKHRHEYRNMLENAHDIEDIISIVNPNGRRYKLNFRTVEDNLHTVEFRQHHGTTNSEDIIQWKDFITALCKYSINQKFKGTMNPESTHSLIENLSNYIPIHNKDRFIKFFLNRRDTYITDNRETLQDMLCKSQPATQPQEPPYYNATYA